MNIGEPRTPYAMKLLSEAYQIKGVKFDQEHFDLLKLLHDSFIMDIYHGVKLDQYYILHDGEGGSYNAEQLIDMFDEYRPIMRVYVARLFEDYFTTFGTDPQTLISSARSGEPMAKRVLSYISSFPLEAINVRTELHMPSYMQQSALTDEHLLTRIFGLIDMSTQDPVLKLVQAHAGPFYPPISKDDIEDYVLHSFDDVERTIRTYGAMPTQKTSEFSPSSALN